MKLKKLTYLFVFVAGISISGFSQPYQKAIGLRLSPSYYDMISASYKFFINDAGALEFNAGFGLKSDFYYNGTYNSYVKPFTFAISAAYQQHFEIPVRGGGLYWFVGGGLTAYKAFSSNGAYDGVGFGLFPTGGVDFKIPRIPLAVSADYRPTIFLAAPGNRDSFYGTSVGFSARYTIGEK